MKYSSFNEQWEFNRGLNSSMAAGFEGTSVEKQTITLPHDAMITAGRSEDAISGPGGGFFKTENCEYVKTLFWPEEHADKVAFLEFDGVYTNATILVNGDFVENCHNGYLNFLVKVNDFLIPGEENQIKVVIKNSMQPNGRWYTGEGIYRDVRLLISDPLYILPDGVQLTTLSADENIAALGITTKIKWEGTGSREADLLTKIYDGTGNLIKETSTPFHISGGDTVRVRQKMFIDEPALWNIDTPNLYKCQSVILLDEKQRDTNTTSFGIRTLQLDTHYGLRINGEQTKLKGGCIHHDNGILGSVSYTDAEMRRVRMMKEAGYNAIRGAHNPVSKALLEACDQLGMLVMEEFTDTWTHTKMDYDYAFFYPSEWEHDVEQMVRRDYNHPCIIMYSIGNEIPETGSKTAASWGRKITEKIRGLDSTRFITNGVNIMMSVIDRIGIIMGDIGMDLAKEGYTPAEINDLMNNTAAVMPKVAIHPIAEQATRESFEMLDIIGLNYAEDVAVKQHEKNPDRIYVGTETLPHNLDKNWNLVKNHDHILGDFSWTAWDYLGEAGVGRIEKIEDDETLGAQSFMGGYPWISAYTGDFDITGFRRPISYWRETVWNGRNHMPYIAVHNPENISKKMFRGNWCWTDSLNSWNWPGSEGRETNVEVYADADEVELFVNGSSLGKKKVGQDGKEFYCKWETVYLPGKVEAVSYINGKEAGRESLATPKHAVICAKTDRTVLNAGSYDLAYIEIELRDEDNILQMMEDQKLFISVNGPVKLLAFGSGNPCTEEMYNQTEHRTYQGRLLAVIQAAAEQGDAVVVISNENGEQVSIHLKVE